MSSTKRTPGKRPRPSRLRLLQRPYSKEELARDSLAWFLLSTFDSTARRVRIATRKKYAYLFYDIHEARFVTWDPAQRFNHDFLEHTMRWVEMMSPDESWLLTYRDHLVDAMENARPGKPIGYLSVELLRPTVMEKGLALKATILALQKKRKVYNDYVKRHTLNSQ